MTPLPDTILNQNDPGDDVQRRFRFQAIQAAFLSLSLLDPETLVEEIYCEHHEDVLIKKKLDRFIGYQVKTKLDNAMPHKAADSEIIRCVERFVEHERNFGQHFDKYVIGSSAGFWNEEKTSSSLPHLLTLVKSQKNGNWPKPVDSLLKKVFPEPLKPKGKTAGTPHSHQANYDQLHQEWETTMQHGRMVFKKLDCEKLSSLNDMYASLIQTLPTFQEVGDRFFSEISAIADHLVSEMLKAAQLEPQSARGRYLAVFDNPSTIKNCEIITGKRVTKERLVGILQQTPTIRPTLSTSTPVSVTDLPKGMSVLETKLAVGEISIENVGLAKDLKASTETLLIQWLHRDGKSLSDKRYQHLRTLVRSESQEAFDNTKNDAKPFGSQMLMEVRQRLRSRYDQEKTLLFGCSYEHLMGIVTILTEECLLWWSPRFAMPSLEEENP